MRVTLYIVGAVLELVGILFVAAPDLLPYTERASRWLRVTTRRLVDRLRRALGLRRDQVVQLGLAGELDLAGTLGTRVVITPGKSMEDRVAYLLRREQEAQDKLNAHDERLRAIEEQMPKRLDELRAETEEHVANEISAAEWRYRPLRFVGALALLLGLALTTTANFL